ncbi:sugar O-acyltransferase (sialic acid O-acetyltransferase NeuD family) [Actinoplanes lutulentus]|uniref:Sugar O-acyltransferase (Sialic acid O-acetyltransferase NeuD family) n=1 Tax=Actinoplanes lutulentus TaxID=1287878 RepID=A0A327YYG8_9ACTN|nr:acetyltransferase [Actinoplanes lutulentus]MBB2940415.1 sugar O-acyltransferase (sialic acid O-acetyltransferase NeuD family) [Actinoplanes lutulentus]RAK25852.1 sugar O-acyltransferase (sialic acid O-acetyltransferase NeuD family) [Actinoplanes lutulentus]
MRDLVIVGAGGFARETASAAAAANRVRPTWRILGFADDNPALHGTVRSGLPILGSVDDVIGTDAAVVVCVGNPSNYTARRGIVERLGLPAERYATVVHPSAEVGAGCTVGPGSVLLAGTVLTADLEVGSHVAVMPHVVITHEDRIEDYVTIASGVRLGGGATLRQGAYIGAGALVREGVTVGAWSQIGMGSVVLRDVPPDEVWVGSPARFLRSAKLEELTS